MQTYYKKGKYEDTGNCRSANYRPAVGQITLRFGKALEYIIKQSICKHLNANEVRRNSQHGSVRNKSYQTHLAFFFERLTVLLEGWGMAYLDFCKALDTDLYSSLIIN